MISFSNIIYPHKMKLSMAIDIQKSIDNLVYRQVGKACYITSCHKVVKEHLCSVCLYGKNDTYIENGVYSSCYCDNFPPLSYVRYKL